MGFKIKDEYTVMKLFCSLPLSCRYSWDALLHRKDVLPSSEAKSTLLSKIVNDKEIVGDKNGNLAKGLVAKG